MIENIKNMLFNVKGTVFELLCTWQKYNHYEGKGKQF